MQDITVYVCVALNRQVLIAGVILDFVFYRHNGGGIAVDYTTKIWAAQIVCGRLLDFTCLGKYVSLRRH